MYIKICGLTDVREVEYLKKNRVDFAGMVLFFEKSKRNISIEKAREIIAALHESGDMDDGVVNTVGVFNSDVAVGATDVTKITRDEKREHRIKAVAVVVSPSDEQIREIENAGFDYIQIHGQIEDRLIELCKLPVLKAFNVSDLDKYEHYLAMDNIKGFVFDAGEPGSGKTFDWDMLKGIIGNIQDDSSNDAPDSVNNAAGDASESTKVTINRKLHILAGGLNADNVERAIAAVNPDGVDISSGVEYADRLGKDSEKIDRFVRAVRVC